MKLFGYLLVACAGLGLFACSTEDDPTIENGDGAKKSVSLKLAGISGSETKATETGTTLEGKIVLKDLKIVFYDNSNPTGPRPIYRVEEFDGTLEADETKWAALTGTAGYVFHDLDPKVNAVLVVGNWKYEGKSFTWTDVSTIKSSVLLANNENQAVNDFSNPTPVNSTKNYVTLWGEDKDLTGPFTDDDHPNATTFTANVEIKPLVARFEIGNIQCTDLGTIYDRFTLKGIGLIDMSLEASMNGYLSPRLVIGTNILEPGNTASGKYEFGNATELAWAYDAIPSVIISSSGTQYNPDGTTAAPDGTKKFVYNFFPDVDDEVEATIDGFPNIKLVLDDVMLKTGPESSFDYVVTAKFTSDINHLTDVPFPTAGKIYTVDLAFKEENIGPWNPDDFKCVIVHVSVADWDIVPLYPVFR